MKPNAWTKSSFSNGNGGNNCVEIAMCSSKRSAAAGHCVEVGFAKAKKSGPNCDNCVEVSVATEHAERGCNCDTITVGGKIVKGAKAGDVLVRDSKDNGTGPIIVLKPHQWEQFLDEVRENGKEALSYAAGFYCLTDPNGSGVELRYTEAEMDAFADGVNNGEFNLTSNVVGSDDQATPKTTLTQLINQ